MQDPTDTLETTLARTEAITESALKAAAVLTGVLKKLLAATRGGDLRSLRKSLETVAQNSAVLRQQCANIQDSWSLDEHSYLANGAFTRELLEAASKAGITISAREDQLYCYPFLIRISPGDRTVSLGKTRVGRIRPSALLREIKHLQSRPTRFKPGTFIEVLYSGYSYAAHARSGCAASDRAVIPLREVYHLLTLLPGASKEYSVEEFARDVYFLDRSGVTSTQPQQGGQRLVLGFHASTGTKSAPSTLAVITEDGRERRYYGISFSAA